jgi:hypothetical protein
MSDSTSEGTNTNIHAKGTKRNFPQVEKKVYYSFEDMKEGSRYEQAGTTDTDSKTEGSGKEGYAKIYKKSGRGSIVPGSDS